MQRVILRLLSLHKGNITNLDFKQGEHVTFHLAINSLKLNNAYYKQVRIPS